MRQVFIGLITEGKTDLRFLKTVVTNTFQEVSWDCLRQVEIVDIKEIKAKGRSFADKMLDASSEAFSSGVTILCIHADSDGPSARNVMNFKFIPFLRTLEQADDNSYCKIIVPTIPVQMIESWMLADKCLLKKLINASDKSDEDLGIEKSPEEYSNPKTVIQNAIRISMLDQPKKRRDQIELSDLYEILGNRLDLSALRRIPSFSVFENSVRMAFRTMGLME